eukprot:4333032-Prymnesium_polylepis.1
MNRTVLIHRRRNSSGRSRRWMVHPEPLMTGRYHTADAGCSMAGSCVQAETWTPAARAACAMAR